MGAVIGILFGALVLALSTRDSYGRDRGRPRRPPFEGPQIVGHACTHCQVRIALYFDADWCRHCGGAVHNGCLASHLAPSDGPYR
jgi:hypothetical protein